MFLGTIQEAWWGVWHKPIRSISVALVLAAGLAAIVMSNAVSLGFERQIQTLTFGPYSRAIVISENQWIVDRHGPPNRTDARKLADKFDDIVSIASWRSGITLVSSGSERLRTTVFGASYGYRDEAGDGLASGRHLTQSELISARRRCVLGNEFARKIDAGDPVLGRIIRINGFSCEIVGVLAPPGNAIAERFSNGIIAPFLSSAYYFELTEGLGPGEASWITIIFADGSDLPSKEMRIDRELRNIHGIPQSHPPAFIYRDGLASVANLARQKRLTTTLMSSVAAISLLAAFIGYTAIISSMIRDRRGEFAMRQAIGASRGVLISQILIELGLIALIGACVGVTFAYLLAHLGSMFLNWGLVFSIPFVLMCAISMIVTGMAVGVYPIRQMIGNSPLSVIRE